MSDDPERPETIALLMRWLAEYTVLCDKAVNQLAEIQHEPRRLTVGGPVEDDLNALAKWFEDHPRFDSSLYVAVFGETT